MTNFLPKLSFANPGELDPRLITTFGANVKESSNPIGYFGTGLKYAIACIVRGGGTLTIHAGAKSYSFRSSPDTIRGKEFDFIEMTEHQGDYYQTQTLAFTTELGKNWSPWMVYRELWSNCIDESGSVRLVQGDPMPQPGTTNLIVDWEPLVKAHSTRHTFIIDSSILPVFADAVLQIYAPNQLSPGIYYRGIRVAESSLELETAKFRYNILSPMRLTEDRTVSPYRATEAITRHIVWESEDPKMIEAVLNIHGTNDSAFERSMLWDSMFGSSPSILWNTTAEQISKSKLGQLSGSAKRMLGRAKPEQLHPTEISLTTLPQTYSIMLDKATAAVTELGYPVDCPVLVSNSMTSGILGTYYPKTKTIFLSVDAFVAGTKQLTMTLLEELIHHTTGAADCSRKMQEVLLHLALDQYEQRKGIPL